MHINSLLVSFISVFTWLTIVPATALGLAAAAVSLHLPTNAYKQERKRRLSEPQSAGSMQASKAREMVLERMNSRADEKLMEKPLGMPPGRRLSFATGTK